MGNIVVYPDSKRRALLLDQQIAERSGTAFGELYTDETLPRDDRLALGIITEDEAQQSAEAETIADIVAEAKQYLRDTDYKVIKEAEGVEPCPDEIKEKRQACRNVINKYALS